MHAAVFKPYPWKQVWSNPPFRRSVASHEISLHTTPPKISSDTWRSHHPSFSACRWMLWLIMRMIRWPKINGHDSSCRWIQIPVHPPLSSKSKYFDPYYSSRTNQIWLQHRPRSPHNRRHMLFMSNQQICLFHQCNSRQTVPWPMTPSPFSSRRYIRASPSSIRF